MKRIAVVTTTRAEYGLLSPLIRRIGKDGTLDLELIVSGTHLSAKYGHTIDEIVKDGFTISCEIPILDVDNSPYGVSVTMANALNGFARFFNEDKPDMVVVLGDRTEMLSVAAAALNERIPIAHIHGGEVTIGAVDDCIRHAITKMSHLHFTSTEVYRKRVIQLGETPERVFNVGALGVENVLTQNLMDEAEIRYDIGIPEDSRYAVVTYHPVTLENDTVEDQIRELCMAMANDTDFFFMITGANADYGGDRANYLLSDFAENHDNVAFAINLGMKRYLSAVKYASFVLGNSSSGILEAPAMGTPTVNIGDRQKGRVMPESVICCRPDAASISVAMKQACGMNHIPSSIYGSGDTSEKIIECIKDFFRVERSLKKGFYDIAINTSDERSKDEIL